MLEDGAIVKVGQENACRQFGIEKKPNMMYEMCQRERRLNRKPNGEV